MAEADHHELIIVRRHEEDEHESHSSAWKVAHADFMTAMMAFFLIMWLINVTDDQVRKGIAEYFNPIHLSQGQTELKGLNQPDPSAKQGGKRGHNDSQAALPEFNPLKLSEGHDDKKSLDSKNAAPAAAAPPAAAAAPAAAPAGAGKGASGEGLAATAAVPAAGSGEAKERAVFQDPYAVLAKLAAQYSAEHPGSVDNIAGDDRKPGLAGGEVDRDPFDPVYWQLADVPSARTDHPGNPGTAAAIPHDVLPDAAAAQAAVSKVNGGLDDGTPLERLDGTPIKLPAPAPLAKEKAPTDAKSATGNAREKSAESKLSAVDNDKVPAEADAAKPEARPAPEPGSGSADDLNKAAQVLGDQIAKSVNATMGSGASPSLTVKATAEGILVDLTDSADFSMFEVGSAIPNGKVVVLMAEIAKALALRPGNIVLRGFTDARPFRSELYDNWRLSAARAQMAHYMLTRDSVDDSRVVRIEGYADRDLKNPSDPNAAENRRIEILLQEAKP